MVKNYFRSFKHSHIKDSEWHLIVLFKKNFDLDILMAYLKKKRDLFSFTDCISEMNSICSAYTSFAFYLKNYQYISEKGQFSYL